MIITHLGGESFKIQFGDIVIAANPISKSSNLKESRYGADVALISQNRPDFNGVQSVTYGGKTPFAIVGPGEYEIKDTYIRGFSIPDEKGNHQTTIYSISIESMDLLFLGSLGVAAIPKPVLEEIGNVDILFIPIGGDDVLAPQEAHKLAVKFEPHLIIPMHYAEQSKDKNVLDVFCKEAGVTSRTTQEKLTIKRKDLEQYSGSVIVLENNA